MTSWDRDATGTQLGLNLDLHHDPLDAAAAVRVVRAHDARLGVSPAATAELLEMLGLAASPVTVA